jgi:hypothetical protein
MPIIPVFHDSTIPIRCQSCDIASMPRFGKQSQSPASRAAGAGRSRQTNPIWPGKRPSGRVFKLSYFSLHFHRIVGGTSCTNEPNFRPACGGGIPTIPLFQYSNPMPILRHRLDAPLRETNQFPRRDRDRGAIVQNKANLARRATGGPVVQTNPFPGSGWDPGADHAKQTQTWASRGIWGTAQRRVFCAKQTQFWPVSPDPGEWNAPNKPNCPKRGTEAVSGKPGGWGRSIMQNEPNSGWSARQGPNAPNKPNFPGEIPHYSTILLFHHPNPIPVAPNKANSPGTAVLRCTNKPNLQRFTTEAQKSQRWFWTPGKT